MRKIFIIVPLVIFLLLTACAGNFVGGVSTKKSSSNETFTLVCFGNSLTSGHGAVIPGVDSPEKSYPAFLQNKVSIPVINAGKTGDTTAQGLSRINNDVLSKNPRIVIIELGANDLFQGVSLTTTYENLKKIISMLNDGNRRIYLAKFYTETIARDMMNMLQITGYNEQTAVLDLYDSMFNELVLSDNIVLIDDIWAGVWGIHMSDHIHPNEKGYEIMADNYFNALKPYLQENNLLR